MRHLFTRTQFFQASRPVALAGLFLLAAGCAGLSDGLSPDAGPALTVLNAPAIETATPVSVGSGESGRPEPIQAAAPAPSAGMAEPGTAPLELAQAPKRAPAGSTGEAGEGAKAAEPGPQAAPDEFFDPFAKKEESLAAGEDYDPWEGFNSAMFEFNRKLDKYLIKPVAQGYDTIMPNALQKGISNFYYNNIHFGPRLLNNVFQLKFKGAGIEISRFLINNIIGLAGFFDPAKHWLELETPQEDSGQTLGAYGVPPGPYLVLPLLPPFTLRDFFGYLLDFGMNPVNYFLLPTFEVDDWPSAIAHKNRDTTTILQLSRTVEDVVNYRSLNLETFEGVEEATVDLYSAVRNAYLQKRAKAIRE
jgi:phospholipid-binding lipoprotein MlaA